MTLAIPIFLLPIRFAAANPTIRVTRGTTQTLTLSVNANEDYWLAGDGQTTTGARDLAERLQTCLRSHGGTDASTFAVTVSSDNVLTITCASAFSILWGDGATTVDPTIFGWTASSTASATSAIAPYQSKGVWAPGQPWTFDSGDEETIIGSFTETSDGGSRGSLSSVIYDRTIRFELLLPSRVRTADADASRPYGTFVYGWTTGGWAGGRVVRVYDDRTSRTSTSYSTYRRSSLARPWKRMQISTRRYQVELQLRRVA